jgi:predicted nucleic acid-binding protein
MKALALELVDGLPPASVVLPVQALGELFQVLVRKAGRSRPSARSAILSWRDAFSLFETSPAAMLAATDLAVTHQFGICDALILSAAADADSTLLLSEDMRDGFIWHGVTIANPFAPTKHPSLKALLSENL